VSHLDRRQVLRLFGAAAAVGATGAVGACGSTETPGEVEQQSSRKVRVGLLAPATGPYLSIGADITQGFKLYLADNNNRLGLHEVELVSADEGRTAQSAQEATDRLLKSGVSVIAGVANPAALAGIREMVEKAQVPVVSANASPRYPGVAPHIWCTSYVDGEASQALGEYLVSHDTFEFEHAYLMHAPSASMRAEVDAFRRAFAIGFRSVVSVVEAAEPFADQLKAVKSSAADVLYCAYSGEAAFAMLEAYRDSGLTIPLLGPGSLTEYRNLDKLMDKGPKGLPDQVITAMNYASDLDNDSNRRFSSGYQKQTGLLPTSYAMAAYDCAAVIDKALRVIGDDITPYQVNKGLGRLGEITSPRGTWTFNTTQTPLQTWYLRRLRFDGQAPANLVEATLGTLG
jgi:branched-chain amino acid transport system substrate-binding protein